MQQGTSSSSNDSRIHVLSQGKETLPYLCVTKFRALIHQMNSHEYIHIFGIDLRKIHNFTEKYSHIKTQNNVSLFGEIGRRCMRFLIHRLYGCMVIQRWSTVRRCHRIRSREFHELTYKSCFLLLMIGFPEFQA